MEHTMHRSTDSTRLAGEHLTVIDPDQLTGDDKARRASIQTEAWMKADMDHAFNGPAAPSARDRMLDIIRVFGDVANAVAWHDLPMLRPNLLRAAGRILAWVETIDREAAR
jgi:hypothetical protein